MYAFFVLIGFVFDMLILIASGALVYAVFQPSLFDHLTNLLNAQLDTSSGRTQLLAFGGIMFLLSFRSLFLLMSRGKSPEVQISESGAGRLALSHASIENVLRVLVETRSAGVRLQRAKVNIAAPGAIDIRLSIELDLVAATLSEFTKDLEAVIRDHFKNRLGLEIQKLDITADYNYPEGQGA